MKTAFRENQTGFYHKGLLNCSEKQLVSNRMNYEWLLLIEVFLPNNYKADSF